MVHNRSNHHPTPPQKLFPLESAEHQDRDKALLNQLASTDAVVWSPQSDRDAMQSLSNLLDSSKLDMTTASIPKLVGLHVVSPNLLLTETDH
jgi:hypothetical protein